MTTGVIESVFASSPDLLNRIRNEINLRPETASLFTEIAEYYRSGSTLTSPSSNIPNDVQEPITKKRKLEAADVGSNALPERRQPRQTILEVKDISFSMPQRKKLHLEIVQYGHGLEDLNTTFALCGRNPSTNQIEFEYPTQAFGHAIRVPVPEKAQKQYNFCLLPAKAQQKAGGSAAPEAVIWTTNHGPLKSYQIDSPSLETLIEGSNDVLERALGYVMQRTNVKLVFPHEDEFASAIPESHRKSEKAFHVKAFRGSKDGFLFFLENGIFFGFKKPLAFFPFDDIDSISYTSVLQRTFNLSISVRSNLDEEPQEIEFSMLDQADFGGIDAYIKQHQLQDASLAEARRAKSAKVNGAKITAANGDIEDDGRTELEKAEAEMIDEEDEMEEDYDPDEEGDSDYDSSGSEDDYEPVIKSGRDLVKEELGSEAEDVSDSDAEDAEPDDLESEHDMEDEDETFDQEAPIKTKVEVTPPLILHHGPDFDDEDQL